MDPLICDTGRFVLVLSVSALVGSFGGGCAWLGGFVLGVFRRSWVLCGGFIPPVGSRLGPSVVAVWTPFLSKRTHYVLNYKS